MKLALVTGTRPQIIKSAPVLLALEKEGVPFSFIHTGQHYDYEMAAQFIDELSIKKPDANLKVGSGTSAYQTAEIISRLSKVLEENRPEILLVPGDTNSALAAALTGFKMDIPTCHLESGLRSYDMIMQEEINRRLIDHGSSGLFAPTVVAVKNLEQENVVGTVFHVGDTMYDILKDKLTQFTDSSFQEETLRELGLNLDEFAVLTLHRRENVDDPERLRGILDGLSRIEHPIVFPIHPRTKDRLQQYNMDLSSNIITVSPISYVRMMSLVSRGRMLLTDSGGLQKEAYLLDTPCVTIRDNTEWVETLDAGANILSSSTADDIESKSQVMWSKKLKNDPSVYGDGKASDKIAKIFASTTIELKRSNMIKSI